MDMPSPIRTAEEAANRADQFLARYHPFKTLLSVHQQQNSWKLVYDVAILGPKKKVVITLDAATGDVTDYGQVDE